jgi:hypothetical protein
LNCRTGQLTWIEGGSTASALFIKLLPATAASGEEEARGRASKRRRNRRALVSPAWGGEVDEVSQGGNELIRDRERALC